MTQMSMAHSQQGNSIATSSPPASILMQSDCKTTSAHTNPYPTSASPPAPNAYYGEHVKYANWGKKKNFED